jgi:hypothetical protein
MFKKLIQSLSKSQAKQAEPTPAPAPAPAAPKAAAPAASKKAAKPEPAAKGKREPLIQEAAPTAPAAPAPIKVEAPKTPEELLGIEGKMNKEQIKDRLRLLYRRYNRAASSLNAATRAEAENMLNAIVTVREKNFGEI